MSNIEKDRRELKISGYVHPTSNNSVYNPYKTFNTENKSTNYATTKKKSAYATFTDQESVQKQSNVCPDCDGVALYVCDCELKDKQCYKGHVWYTNKSGQIKRGDPHDD